MISIKTILVVENDPVSLSMYRKRLEREGFRVECAQDGLEATTMLSENTPDLVLLDLILPKLNGALVLEYMHADPRLTTVPVIILSNAPMTEVPPDSPLALGTRRLVKGECTFATLLQAIQETLAATPEFVVVEASATPATPAPAAGNGESNRNGAGATASSDSPGTAAKRRAEFLKAAMSEFPKIRENCLAYIKAPGSPDSQVHLSGLHQRVHLLHTNATQAGCVRLARLATTFDALLSGIVAKPASVTPSILQTIAQAVDCAGGLLRNDDNGAAEPSLPTKVLVVDDDPVCNHVNVTSLKRANFDAVGVEDPLAALGQLEAGQFDLVVLDVNMPGITGFELCEKIRRLPHCKTIPVIFVTAFSNFDNRKQSVLSGGDDFVTKPVSPLELALKVTVHLIKVRGQRPRLSRPEASPAAAEVAGETPQPANPPQPNRPFPAEVRHRDVPVAFPPTTESGTNGARTADSPFEPSPEAKPCPATVSEDALQPMTSTQTSAPGISTPQELPPVPALVSAAAQAPAPIPCPANLFEMAPRAASPDQPGRPAPVEPLRHPDGSSFLVPAADSASSKLAGEQAARNGRWEQELAELRRAHDELQGKFTTGEEAAAKLRQEIDGLQSQLRQRTEELEHARADLQQQSAERSHSESELRGQLNAANAVAEQVEQSLKAKEAHCNRLDEELTRLRQVRDEMQGRFTTGEEAMAKFRQESEGLQRQLLQRTEELERVRAELQQQSAERSRLESELRGQLNAANAVAEQAGRALKEKEGWCGLLEEELAGLRQVRDALQDKFTSGEAAAAKLRQEIEGLQSQARQSAAELEHALAGLQQQAAERSQFESELRGQLSAANEAAQQKEIILKERETRCSQLEQELAGLRQVRDKLQSEAATVEAATAKFRQEVEGLQDQLRQSHAELERVRVDRGERIAELTEAKAAAGRTESALKEKEEWCSLLEGELAGLRQVHDKLQGRISSEEQAAATLRQEIQGLQDRLQQSQAELKRVQAELQEQSAERTQMESESRSLADAAEALRSGLLRLRDISGSKARVLKEDTLTARAAKPAEPVQPVESPKPAEPMEPAKPAEPGNDQTFHLSAPGARNVFLTGDFTDWRERAIRMQNHTDGLWTTTVKLAPGTYHYLFLVDDEWRGDPDCATRVPNSVGGYNMVRVIKP